MNRRHFLFTAVATTSALLLGFAAPVSSIAQGGPGGGRGFGAGMMGGRNGQNPAQSAAMTLIKRDDVRSELLLTAQQREQLEALDTTSQTEMRQQITQVFQGQNFNPQDFQNLSPEERQAKMQEIQGKVQSTIQTYQGDLDKRIEKILNSKATGGVAQMTRLRQLDLQWRGPLALVDKNVADRLPLTPDQPAKIQPIYQEYQTQSMQVMQKSMGDMRALFTGNNGAPPDRAAIQKEMQKRMEAAQPEMDKLKAASGLKVLALLTPEQQQKWKDLQGRKFTFRTSE